MEISPKDSLSAPEGRERRRKGREDEEKRQKAEGKIKRCEKQWAERKLEEEDELKAKEIITEKQGSTLEMTAIKSKENK